MLPYEVLTLEGITPVGVFVFAIAAVTAFAYPMIKWLQAETKVKQTSVENEKLRTEGDNKLQTELIGLFRDTVGGIQELSKSIRDSHDGAERRAKEAAETTNETNKTQAEILRGLTTVATENNGMLKKFDEKITDLSETAHRTRELLEETFKMNVQEEMTRIKGALLDVVKESIATGLKDGIAEIEAQLPPRIQAIVKETLDRELPPIIQELVKKEIENITKEKKE